MEEFCRVAREYNLYLIEDAAQSLGARWKERYTGTWADVGIFSMNYGKNLVVGGGGFVSTNSDKIYEKMRAVKLVEENRWLVLRRLFALFFWYQLKRFTFPFFLIKKKIWDRIKEKIWGELQDEGWDLLHKMSNIDADIGLIQLDKLEEMIAKRKRNAKILSNMLSEVKDIKLPDPEGHIFTKYLIVLENDDTKVVARGRTELFLQFDRCLRLNGIDPQHGYTVLHLRKDIRNLVRWGNLPNAERLWRGAIALPIHPMLNEEKMKLVGKVVREFFDQ